MPIPLSNDMTATTAEAEVFKRRGRAGKFQKRKAAATTAKK